MANNVWFLDVDKVRQITREFWEYANSSPAPTDAQWAALIYRAVDCANHCENLVASVNYLTDAR